MNKVCSNLVRRIDKNNSQEKKLPPLCNALDLQSHPSPESRLTIHHGHHHTRRHPENPHLSGIVGQRELEVLQKGSEHGLHLEDTVEMRLSVRMVS